MNQTVLQVQRELDAAIARNAHPEIIAMLRRAVEFAQRQFGNRPVPRTWQDDAPEPGSNG